MDLSLLNEPQREAVMTTEGPLLVLAGAGSGKTRVLTHRIAYLISENRVSPRSVLALTFTNKAAGEMRERVESLVGASASDMWVMTFHACCARILRMDIDALGFEKTFVIYDDADQLSLMKRIIKELNLSDKDFAPRMLLSVISEAKNHSVDAMAYFRDTATSKEIVSVYVLYQRRLKEMNALDFDDLLLYTLHLFEQYPDTLEKYRRRFRYILVDEYQDTNLVQYRIVQLLAEAHGNICVVGDDDQSIYGWRGADVRNILEFEKDFPGAKIIRLEQNYRSTEVILNAANLVISNNRGRKKKTLWTAQKGGAPLDAYEAMDERDEANRICGRILEGARMGERSYDDYAILYRTHAQSRVLEMYLKGYNIPYRVYGGTSFFQRAEVKDVVAYLRLLQNPNDDMAFLRIVNVPRRGIGDGATDALQAYAHEKGVSLMRAAMALKSDPSAVPRARAKFILFTDSMTDVYMRFGTQSFTEVVEYLLSSIEYDAYLREDKKENYEARAEIVNEFVSYIREFSAGVDETQTDVLTAFLENVALFSAADDVDEKSGRVSLMTLHSAKGLEFPVVFLPGLEDGLFPSSRSISEPEKLEEERRLLYVGITRARERLYLSMAKQRMNYGRIETAAPSRFWDELKDALPPRDRPETFRPKPAPSAQQPFGLSMHALTDRSERKAKPLSVSSPQNAAPAKRSDVSFAAGERIRHAAFGAGTVLSVTGSSGASIIEIAFDSGVNKKFAAAYAPIEKLTGGMDK